jgi:vesicle-associated membrane protein 7
MIKFLKYFFSYNFFYEDERDLTYLCICKNLNEDVAFSFINDLKKSFLKKYDQNTILGAYAYQLRDFVEEMKNLIKFYEENPNHSKTTVLLNNLNDTAGILRESVEELLDRNEKMNIIAQKSKHLKSTSEDLRIFVNYQF